MAHLVTGYAGHEHIQSKDQGAFNAIAFGKGQLVMDTGNKFNASIVDNNTVRIFDGEMLMHGRHIRIEPNSYEDCVIRTGTAGKNRVDLICMTYEKNANDGTEKAYLQVVQGSEVEGTATLPTYTEGDILQGASFNQMPLYKVVIEGVVLKSVEKLFEVGGTYKEQIDKLSGQVNSIQTTSSGTLSETGWYRVAEYAGGNSAQLRGRGSNSCDLIIKRWYSSNQNETHYLRLLSVIDSQEFKSVGSKSKVQLITKVRYTYDSTKAYLEVYYSGTERNEIICDIVHPKDYDIAWTKLDFIATSETVDGVTVTTTYDIPSNASPVTDLDLANYLPKTGGTIGNSSQTKSYGLGMLNSLRNIVFQLLETGAFRFYDVTNGKNVFVSALDGTNTFNGTASGNLPLTGGDINGDVRQVISTNDYIKHTMINSARNIIKQISNSGHFGLYDNTNEKYIMESSPSGISTFHGTATGNLPLDGGGTVQSASTTPFGVKTTSGNVALIAFNNSNSKLGGLGFNGQNNPIYQPSGGGSYSLLHKGNSVAVAVTDDETTPPDINSFGLWFY